MEAPNIVCRVSCAVCRVLTLADAASIEAGTGIAAKAPDGTWTEAEHVAGAGAGDAAANSHRIFMTRCLIFLKHIRVGMA